MNKKVAFHTLGCKVNQYETEAIAENFIKEGYEKVDFSQVADIYVVNTCTVTNIADKKSRQMLAKAKKMNQDALVVAVGCYAQMEKEKLADNKDIDLIIGNTNKNKIVEYVHQYMEQQEQEQILTVEDVAHTRDYEELFVSKIEGQTRVFVKIQDGCNQFCSYCIIPYTRGRVRSRKPKSIVEEVTKLADNGYQEIVLTGIHIASYGMEFENYHLIDLLEDLSAINKIARIRLGSVEPTLIQKDFVKRLASFSKICPHFHLSLQSGCDSTLKRMNRKYSTKDYEEAVKLLREYYNRPSITTDVIVGFPGETEEEFLKTKEFLKKIQFADLHIFKYSIRKGTKAATMKDQVSSMVKNKRSKELIHLNNDLKKEYLKQWIGSEVNVLFEEKIEEQQVFVGHTDRFITVEIKDSTTVQSNTIKPVRLIGIKSDRLRGNLI